jgi:hypothetical protein
VHVRRERKELKPGTRTYVSVVHNVTEKPEEGKPRAKPVTLLNLGREDELEPTMVEGVIGTLRRYLEKRRAAAAPEQPVAETAAGIAAEIAPRAAMLRKLCSRHLGLKPLLEAAWRDLKLGATLRLFQTEHQVKFAFERVIFGLVWNRLVDPRSKMAANDWLKDEAYFPEGKKLELQHFYRALDILETHATDLQIRMLEALRRALPEADWNTLLTDTTTTYVDSSLNDEDHAAIAEMWNQHDANPTKVPEPAWPRPQVVNEPPLRMQGKSKDERPRSPQVKIGFLTNPDGIVLYHRVAPGNQADGPAALDLVEDFERIVPMEGKRWVGDSGMGTQPVLDELDNRDDMDRTSAQRLRQNKFLDGILSRKGRYRRHPKKAGWSYRVVKVSKEESPHGRAEQWIVTRNNRDRARRLLLLDKHVARVKDALAADDRIDGRVNGVRKVLENPTLRSLVKRTKGDRARYVLNKKNLNRERRLAGLAAICATGADRDPLQAITEYRQLLKTEDAFKTFKGTIRLRPMYHRASHRIRAHVLVCVIALNVIRYLEKRLDESFADIKKAWATSTASLMERDGTNCWMRDAHDERQTAMLAKLGVRAKPEVWKA